MSSDPLEALKTPLGAFEPNVLLAGLEASLATWLGVTLVTGRYALSSIFDKPWHWSLAVWGLLLLAGIVLLGLIVEGLAGALERKITWTSFNSHKLRPRFAELLEEPDAAAWRDAQRWIWKSDQASSEFARRRLRLLAARNTAFVLIAGTITISGALVVAQPEDWAFKLVVLLPSGLLATALFVWVWVAAQQGYNRAVQDALRTGPP